MLEMGVVGDCPCDFPWSEFLFCDIGFFLGYGIEGLILGLGLDNIIVITPFSRSILRVLRSFLFVLDRLRHFLFLISYF